MVVALIVVVAAVVGYMSKNSIVFVGGDCGGVA